VHIYDITKLINITPHGPGAAEGKWTNFVIVLAVKPWSWNFKSFNINF